MMRKITKIIAVGLTILIIISVMTLAIIIDRTKITSAVDFWYLTAKVDLGSKYVDVFIGGRYPVLDGKWIRFDRPEYHGAFVCRVSAQDVLKIFPDVLLKFEERSEKAQDDDYFAR